MVDRFKKITPPEPAEFDVIVQSVRETLESSAWTAPPAPEAKFKLIVQFVAVIFERKAYMLPPDPNDPAPPSRGEIITARFETIAQSFATTFAPEA
jgi:hypothetical protein